MTRFSLICQGSAAAPTLVHDFDMVGSDSFALEAAKKWSTIIASDNYWQFTLNKNDQYMVAEWSVRRTPVVTNVKELDVR